LLSMAKNTLIARKIPMICDLMLLQKLSLRQLTDAGTMKAADKEMPVCKVLKYDLRSRVFSLARQPIKRLRRNYYDEANEVHLVRDSTSIICDKRVRSNNGESRIWHVCHYECYHSHRH